MDEQIERNGKTYRKMRVGELVQKGDIMNGILGWTEAFDGTSYEVANHGACYYHEVQPEAKPETPAPIEDGGPAFPLQDWDECIHSRRIESGMTLRDWFAGQALAGFAANPRMIDSRSPSTLEIVSEWSFEAADAMIKARREVQHG
jgi:hypothetical protein